MSQSLLLSAIANNARWCELVGAAHGLRGVWRDQAWWSTGDMPPFYPNVVTLQPDIPPGWFDTIAHALPNSCGCKDSFADLDLSQFGFHVGFSAEWYGLTDLSILPPADAKVFTVSSAGELVRWVEAWGETPVGQSIFTRDLIQTNAQFLYTRQGGAIEAGLVAYRSDGVVGISNAFGEFGAIVQCVRAAMLYAGEQPVVGYGSTQERLAMSTVGFAGLGQLMVWLR